MVFTAAQITSFFEDADQCGLDHRTRVSLLNVEGITSMDDLADWEDDDWDRWATSYKKPDKDLTTGNLVEQQAFQLTVKSLKRLKLASALVRYYESVSIPLTHMNMKWLVLKSFDTQMKAMKDRKRGEVADVPKLSGNTTVPRWNDSLKAYMNEVFGARGATLRYLMRESDTVPAAGPLTVLAANSPHTAEGKSIEADQMARLSHTHALYSYDNSKFCRMMEEAVHGTAYETSIEHFRIIGDGRGAYRSLLAQHYEEEKWTQILRSASEYVSQRNWDSIKSNGMSNNLEKAVETLLSVNPVANKLGKKRKNAQVSGVTGQKKTRPTTGVELRFYKYKEFAALTDAQREELRELRPKGKGSDGKYKFGKDKGKSGTPTKGNNHRTKKQINGEVAALLKEQLKKRKKWKGSAWQRKPFQRK